MSDDRDALTRLLGPTLRRIAAMLGRGLVTQTKDSDSLQELQLEMFPGEVLPGVPRLQNYGFTSRPHAGSEAAVIFLGGARSQGLAIAVEDRRYRIAALQEGEVAIYTDEGDSVIFKRNREVHFTAGTKLVIDSPRVEITGDLIDNTAHGNAHTVKDMRTIFNAHKHAGGAVPDTSM